MLLEQEINECKGWTVEKRSSRSGYMQRMCVYVGDNSARSLHARGRPRRLIAEMSYRLQVSFGPFSLLPIPMKLRVLGATARG